MQLTVLPPFSIHAPEQTFRPRVGPASARRIMQYDTSNACEPGDLAFIEAFNGRFRAECPNAHWFLTLADEAEKLEAWRKHPPRTAVRRL